MKHIVIYATMTGHSKKIANAIASDLGCKAVNIKENPVLEPVDVLYVVGGVYGGQSLPDLIKYLENMDGSIAKKAVIITSSASVVAKQEQARSILEQKGIEVLEEEYTCKGAFLIMGLGHPNKEEIKKAVEFAKKNA